MAYMPPSILSGTGDLSSYPAAASSPVVEVCVDLGAALPFALPLKTPLERDPLVERSDATYTRARGDGDKSVYG
jgi:hypothetical protein